MHAGETMPDNPYLSAEHFRRVARRYLLKQRRIVEDIARACEVLGRYDHPGAAAARDTAAGLQSALLEYEIALAGANRHAFGDRRRTRPRVPRFLQPQPALLGGAADTAQACAFVLLNTALARLGQAVGNLQIRTGGWLPPDMAGTDAIDRCFMLALVPVLQRLDAELARIGWRVRHKDPTI